MLRPQGLPFLPIEALQEKGTAPEGVRELLISPKTSQPPQLPILTEGAEVLLDSNEAAEQLY